MELRLDTALDGRLILCTDPASVAEVLTRPNLYRFVWLRKGRLRMEVDRVPGELAAGEVVCLTPLHRVAHAEVVGEATVLLFDSNFYCIFGHDNEVSCNGLLFTGSTLPVRFTPDAATADDLQRIVNDMRRDYRVADSLSEEALRMHLKRFIIACTRIARERYDRGKTAPTSDIVRRFRMLVDEHFRQTKRVGDYAEMLHRSPKTLSNLFASTGSPSPREIIRDRVNAEARRLLLYTNLSVKEIAEMLGFEDTAALSRFFAKLNGENISRFRAREHEKQQSENLE